MGRPVLRLSGFSPLISGPSVTLEGDLLRPAAYLLGLVNQGSYGVARCAPDTTVALPRFRLSCPVLDQDSHALIELATRREGDVLLTIAAQLEVRRDDNSDLSYEAGSYGDNQLSPSPDAFGATLLSGLNRIRAAAGVGQLSLELEQSRTNGRLAPHLFLGSLTHDADELNTIALGALAGWDVQGTIRDGGIFFGSVNSTRNPSHWLTYALESPLGRLVLLSPDMSRAAVGVSSLDPGGVAALITTYSFFGSTDHRADEVALLQELARQRALRGLPAPVRVQSDQLLLRALERVSKNEQTSMDALRSVVQELSDSAGQPVAGYLIETTDLKLAKFDPHLLSDRNVKVQLGVTHYKVPGAAWGQYAVLFAAFNGN
jgi:hypothetical protein